MTTFFAKVRSAWAWLGKLWVQVRAPLLGVVVGAWAIGALVRRVVYLGYLHLGVVDALALMVSLVLVTMSVLELLRGRAKRAVALLLLECVAYAFVFVRVDLPAAMAFSRSPEVRSVVLRTYANATEYLHLDESHIAGYERVEAAGGGTFLVQSESRPPAKVVPDLAACKRFRSQEHQYGLDQEVSVTPGLARVRIRCDHLEHRPTVQLAADYLDGTRAGDTAADRGQAARDAFLFGDLDASKMLMASLVQSWSMADDHFGLCAIEATPVGRQTRRFLEFYGSEIRGLPCAADRGARSS